MSEMNDELEANAVVKVFTDRAYKICKVFTFGKMIVSAIALSAAIFLPLAAQEWTVRIWLPKTWNKRQDVFYIGWVIASVVIFHYGPFFVVLHEFFFNMLIMINGYQQYFQWKLRKIPLDGVDGEEILKICVKMHQKLRRLVGFLKFLINFQYFLDL